MLCTVEGKVMALKDKLREPYTAYNYLLQIFMLKKMLYVIVMKICMC